MKITAIETFVVNTGFKPPRPWHFCAIRTDEGLTGYSEFGSEGITRGLVGLIQDFGHRLIGKDPTAVEKHYLDMYRAVRQAPYGATQQVTSRTLRGMTFHIRSSHAPRSDDPDWIALAWSTWPE
jgi:L-alanine-DL-glutamate epimerase-like enolase superfamily enzyme